MSAAPSSPSRSVRGAPCRCLSTSNCINGVISSRASLQIKEFKRIAMRADKPTSRSHPSRCGCHKLTMNQQILVDRIGLGAPRRATRLSVTGALVSSIIDSYSPSTIPPTLATLQHLNLRVTARLLLSLIKVRSSPIIRALFQLMARQNRRPALVDSDVPPHTFLKSFFPQS